MREILILDNSDLDKFSGGITLTEFLQVIRYHVDNVGKTDDEIFVWLDKELAFYDDEQDTPQISFGIKEK